MSLGLILTVVAILGGATLLAHLRFSIARPAAVLVVLGFFGAVLMIFGIEAEIDPLDPQNDVRWGALIGTLISFVSLLGLLALILIWAIRRWGLGRASPEDDDT